jgi:predicted RNA polymerase sigma factor
MAEFDTETEALGLLALIELGESRRPGRTSADGIPLTLAEVDRSAWGRQRMSRGLALATRALPGGGRFALQAGISGLHSSAPRWEDTDWNAIVTLYFGLERVWPAPVVRVGALVARSHLGPAELDRAVAELRSMPRDRRVSAALADLEERRGDIPAAIVGADQMVVVLCSTTFSVPVGSTAARVVDTVERWRSVSTSEMTNTTTPAPISR